ncbi:15436_t:CDS:2, partial [Entrophospora sp. SA101]
ELYQSTLPIRSKLVKLIEKYSQKKVSYPQYPTKSSIIEQPTYSTTRRDTLPLPQIPVYQQSNSNEISQLPPQPQPIKSDLNITSQQIPQQTHYKLFSNTNNQDSSSLLNQIPLPYQSSTQDIQALQQNNIQAQLQLQAQLQAQEQAQLQAQLQAQEQAQLQAQLQAQKQAQEQDITAALQQVTAAFQQVPQQASQQAPQQSSLHNTQYQLPVINTANINNLPGQQNAFDPNQQSQPQQPQESSIQLASILQQQQQSIPSPSSVNPHQHLLQQQQQLPQYLNNQTSSMPPTLQPPNIQNSSAA